MNNIIITGYIVKDAELRYTTNKTAVTNFTVAAKRDYSKEDKTDFINCFTLGKEKLTQYLTKGTLICIRGSLQIDSYKDKEGKNRTAAKVKVDDVQLLGKKQQQQQQQQQQQGQMTPPGFMAINDDDIPF